VEGVLSNGTVAVGEYSRVGSSALQKRCRQPCSMLFHLNKEAKYGAHSQMPPWPGISQQTPFHIIIYQLSSHADLFH